MWKVLNYSKDYFTWWMLIYITVWFVMRRVGGGRVERFSRWLDPYAIAIFLFYGYLMIVLVSIIVWRHSFDISFIIISIMLHGIGLALPYLSSGVDINPSRGWIIPFCNISILWFVYLAVVGGSDHAFEVYYKMPTRWKDIDFSFMDDIYYYFERKAFK